MMINFQIINMLITKCCDLECVYQSRIQSKIQVEKTNSIMDLFGNQKITPGPPKPASNEPPKQYVKPQGTGLKPKDNPFGGNIDASQPKAVPFGHQPKQPQQSQPMEGRQNINDVLSGRPADKKQDNGQSMFTSKPQQLEINNDKSSLSKQSTIKNPPKSTGVRYRNNYNPLAIYDILNDYYQLCQFPTEVSKDLVANLSKILVSLFKQTDQKQQYSISKIEFTALNTIPDDYKEAIKYFWFEVIKEFIENWHPYCSFQGIIALTQFHLKQNHQRYYPSGKYNLQPFLEVLQPNIPKNATLANMNISMGFDLKSPFVQEILQALSEMLCVFINQFCTIMAAVPKDLFLVLLNNEIIVQNIFKVIKDIFNVDYAYRCGDEWTKHQIGVYLFNSLIHLHGKNAAIFNKRFVNQFVIFLDQHLQTMSPNFSVKVPADLDKTPSSVLARKCIKLLNALLFKFPYQLQKWEASLKNTITYIKSQNLAPFKWTLQPKKSQPYFAGSRFRQSFDHHDEFSINATAYFPIVGTEWLLLLKNMIKNQPSTASTNQYYKSTVFYLMCSIIESDTIGFWMDAQAYHEIHNEIIDIYEDLQRSLPNSLEQKISIGKLCRVMICACGNMTGLDRVNQIPRSLIEKLCKDTITLSTSSISLQSGASKNTNFSSLVLSHFASTIIGNRNLTRDLLFGEIFLSQLMSNNLQIQIFSNSEPVMLRKYSYVVPELCVYQLVRKIMAENVNTVEIFAELWAKMMAKGQMLEANSDQQIMIEFLNAMTFGQLIKVNEVLISFNPNQSFFSSKTSVSPFDFLPEIFRLFNSLLRFGTTTKYLTVSLLQHDRLIKKNGLKQLLIKCINSEQNCLAFTQHVECLYETGLQEIEWCTDICMSVLAESLTLYEEIGARCYANITRIAVAKKCLSHGENEPLSQLNMLKISPMHQFLSSSTIQSRLADSSMIKIPELIKYSDYILQFIKWALKLEQDSLHPESFYNSLFVLGKFETLSTALKLLEVLIVVYSKFHDRVHFVEKLRRFLAVCVISTKEIGPLLKGSLVNNISNAPQIYLSNKKVATLPACLAYIIVEPGFLRRPAVKQLQMLRAKEIRSLAINILNLIILNLNNPTLVLLSSASAWQSPYSSVDPFSSIDFSVYEQFFTESSQKAYACPKQKLLAHIGQYLCHGTSEIKTVTPLVWFQTSYMYGQYVDLMLQSTKLFNQVNIKDAIERRINQELENRDKISTEIRRAFNKIQGDFEALNGDRIGMPSYLIDYLCDREVATYSRYILQLCLHIQPPNSGQQHHIGKLLEVVLNKLLVMIVEQPDGAVKNSVIESVSLNIWKSIRILQTKQQNPNSLKLFTATACRCMPFILNYYHLNIGSADYIKEYLISFRIILACKEYLTPALYNSILAIEKLRQMLVRLMREAADKVQYYSILLYTLNLYMDCVGSDTSYKEQLYSIYQIVNETVNPVVNSQQLSSSQVKNNQKRELSDLNKDITVISLILFFKQEIGQQIQNRQSSSANLFSLLLSSNPSSSSALSTQPSPSFNLQSLLFNFSGNRQYIPTALQIASSASHYLEFVSVCNYLYRMIAAKDTKSVMDIEYDLMNETILVFIQKILDLGVQTDSAWRNVVYMKSWACNLLYIMIVNCSKPTLFKISHFLINKNNLIALMGELLTLYGEVQIKWSFTNTSSVPVSKLGLLEKELLLSILKVYAALIARNQDWFKKPTFGNNDGLKKSNYYNLCKMFVNASKVLVKSSASPLVDQFRTSNTFEILSVPSTTVARGQFEQTLQKFAVQNVFGSLSTATPSNHSVSSSLARLSIEPSKLRILHPDCTSVLDIVHDHFNLLITEKYMMILMGCYANIDLTLDKYEFRDVMAVFEAVSRRLAEIASLNASTSTGSKIYETFLKEIDLRVWSTTKMSTNLCYLNQIQESPRDQKEMLNGIAELALNCLLTIKDSMKMHQDYKQFYLRADKLFKTARKSEKIYQFDIKDYIEAGGFESKSQYGASFMLSPSTKRYSGTATKMGF